MRMSGNVVVTRIQLQEIRVDLKDYHGSQGIQLGKHRV
jgi:hypothetical protein